MVNSPYSVPWDMALLREDFPILTRTIRSHPMAYLDSAATSQKPRQVLDAEYRFYTQHNAAVHRGASQLAEEATGDYEASRRRVAEFIGAKPDDLVFTRNATEAINLVAYSFLNSTLAERSGRGPRPDPRFVIGEADEIVVTAMEHHANLVPWQELAAKTGARLLAVDVTDDGYLDWDHFGRLLSDRTRVVAATHQSNLLGTINPVEQLAALRERSSALWVLDACQSVPHIPFSVAAGASDFVAFSGHKMLGPTGVGCLWAVPGLLEAMPPFLTGGSMVRTVTLAETTYADPPQRFEAGVPMMAQAVGLAAACDYLDALGMDNIARHEAHLTEIMLSELDNLPGVRIIGPRTMKSRAGAVSFVVDGVHAHDVGQVLDSEGLVVRVGHHCAAPLCQRFDVTATVRASVAVYNTVDEVVRLAPAVRKAQEYFGVAP